MITCPACGTQNADGSNFCIACGSDLNSTATDQRVRTDSATTPTAGQPPASSPGVDMPPGYLDAPAATPPSPAPLPPPIPIPSPSYTTPRSAGAAAGKDRSLALILEIVGGAVGLPGIGWLYAGQTVPGLVLLGVMLALDAAALVVALFTVFISCVCSIPLTWAVMGVSAYLLNNHTRQHPETFGA